MAPPKLLEPDVIEDDDGPKVHNPVLPTNKSQFNGNKDFGERWNKALQTSVKTRSDRKKADDAALKADPSLENKPGWREAYDTHEERLDNEMAAQEVVNEFLLDFE